MYSCSFSLTQPMKNLIKRTLAFTNPLLCRTWKVVFKASQSPNNPYRWHCPQPNSRGSCPLINLACPSAKHWIRLQDWCIIQHSRGWERKSVVWSHLTLGRAAKREGWRRMRGRNESDGRGGEDGGEEETERRGGGGGGEWWKEERERNKVQD